MVAFLGALFCSSTLSTARILVLLLGLAIRTVPESLSFLFGFLLMRCLCGDKAICGLKKSRLVKDDAVRSTIAEMLQPNARLYTFV